MHIVNIHVKLTHSKTAIRIYSVIILTLMSVF